MNGFFRNPNGIENGFHQGEFARTVDAHILGHLIPNLGN